MAGDKLQKARRLRVALTGLEQLERAEFSRQEQQLSEAVMARDQALENLSGDSVLGGLFIDVIARHLSRMDREIEIRTREQAARLQSLAAAHRRTKGAADLVERAEVEDENAEERRALEIVLERSLNASAQGPRKRQAR